MYRGTCVHINRKILWCIFTLTPQCPILIIVETIYSDLTKSLTNVIKCGYDNIEVHSQGKRSYNSGCETIPDCKFMKR